MKLSKFLRNALDVGGALILTGGFVITYNKMFGSDDRWEIFILLTLPLIVGSVMSQKEFRFESLLFLESSITMIIGFLIMLSIDSIIGQQFGVVVMSMGAFMFSLGLLRLWLKVSLKLKRINENNNE